MTHLKQVNIKANDQHTLPLSANRKIINTVKPNTTTAMKNLIDEVRLNMPFGADETQLCSDSCQGCSKKLLEFLETEISDWEQKLQDGIQPNFGDINRMGKTCKKVYVVLKKNGLIEDQPTN